MLNRVVYDSVLAYVSELNEWDFVDKEKGVRYIFVFHFSMNFPTFRLHSLL
jgi:hypothetical protein